MLRLQTSSFCALCFCQSELTDISRRNSDNLMNKDLMAIENVDRKHCVLVHGAGHGAWTWYKLKPRLESAGHMVTVIDLAASGINRLHIQDVNTIPEYTKPLLELLASLPPNKKVVLVGHSLGGINLALAMEKFPEKVAVGVFITAMLPDTEHRPSYVMDKYFEMIPSDAFLDSAFFTSGSKSCLSFGPQFLATKVYQFSPIEDLELAKTLIRPTSLFVEDMSQTQKFSKEGYASVPRVFIICKEDKAIPLKYQLWMIQNSGVDEVMEIEDADHMAMLSKPQELCDILLPIAFKYT